jgi:hypothetical protein
MLAGIDWASEEHAVCVLDDEGRVVDRFAIAHSAEGFDRLTARLARHGDPAEVPVATERPDGRLVDRLLEAGHPAVPVKTNARTRPGPLRAGWRRRAGRRGRCGCVPPLAERGSRR